MMAGILIPVEWKVLHPLSKYHITPNMKLFTNACGGIGFGNYFEPHWEAEWWPPEVLGNCIEWKELLPILISCKLWVHQWKGKRLRFHCENLSVMNLWKNGTSLQGELMDIIRKLLYCSARQEFTVEVVHIPGVDNSISDTLSRFQFCRFRTLASRADQYPVAVMQEIWQVLSVEMNFYQFMVLAESSCCTCWHEQRKFTQFCREQHFSTYPVTEYTLRVFTTYMARTLSY